MLVVRYPNGQAVQYNDAYTLYRENDSWSLYANEKKTKWIASIQLSAGVIVEAVTPCRVYNSIEKTPFDNLTNEIVKLKKEIRKLKKGVGK